MSRFQFVADHQHAFEVKRLCELVQVERSSFYAWVKAGPEREARAAADAELADKIRRIHSERVGKGVMRPYSTARGGGRGRVRDVGSSARSWPT